MLYCFITLLKLLNDFKSWSKPLYTNVQAQVPDSRSEPSNQASRPGTNSSSLDTINYASKGNEKGNKIALNILAWIFKARPAIHSHYPQPMELESVLLAPGTSPKTS